MEIWIRSGELERFCLCEWNETEGESSNSDVIMRSGAVINRPYNTRSWYRIIAPGYNVQL